MSEKATSLPLPAAIDAAYLLLVGQLCVSLSKLGFAVAYVYENNIPINPSLESALIWILSGLITIMLFINILSCWRSTRSTFDEIGHYPNSMLTSDVLIIVSFFFLNSVAAAPLNFMQGLTLDTPSISKFLSDVQRLWEPVIPLLFISSAFLVLSYRAWNNAYYSALEKIEPKRDEKYLSDTKSGIYRFNSLYILFSILFILFSICQILFDQIYMTASFIFVWLIFWGYVNFSWILSPPTDPIDAD